MSAARCGITEPGQRWRGLGPSGVCLLLTFGLGRSPALPSNDAMIQAVLFDYGGVIGRLDQEEAARLNALDRSRGYFTK